MATIGATLTTEQLDAIKDKISITEERQADGTTFKCYESNNINLYEYGMNKYFKSCSLKIQAEAGVSQAVIDAMAALDTNSTLESVKTAFMDWIKEKDYVAKIINTTYFPKV